MGWREGRALSFQTRSQNSAPTWGPDPGAYQTEKNFNMDDKGIPELVGRAFLQASDTLKSVILTRVPGKAATDLIKSDYCMKSFYVHAKSCNWGPMAGFVAHLPALNKKGVSNIAFNQKSHLETEKKFKNLAGEKITASPFIPLGLTESAFNDHLKADLQKNGYFNEIDDMIVGITYDKDKTVLIEYLLQWKAVTMPGNLSSVLYAYHRNIYIKRDVGETYKPYLQISHGQLEFSKDDDRDLSIPNPTTYPYLPDPLAIKLQHIFDEGWKELYKKDKSISIPTATSLTTYYPIYVAQNPYRTYDEGDPRNAVTGDYDLFAVWPVGLFSRWDETIRLSEYQVSAPPAKLFGGALFVPNLIKCMSLQLVHAPNIYVEVIPNFAQMEKENLEDPELGNINDAVHMAGGMLNSLVYAKYLKPKKVPNIAFHSDEGGRPEVFEIEFPLAAFLPRGIKLPKKSLSDKLTKTEETRGLVINNAIEFMDLLELLKGQATIPLAYGWLAHLLILVDLNETMEKLIKEGGKLKNKREAYLNSRKTEREEIKVFNLTKLRIQLWSLLTGIDKDEDVLNTPAATEAMRQTTAVFAKLLYSDMDVYDKIDEIRKITMGPA
jgi:hypothetical protein